MRVQRIASGALVAAMLTVGSASTTSSAITSGFEAGVPATQPAVRVEPPFGFRMSCPFRMALDEQGPEPVLALHRFDGNSSNDRRVELQDADLRPSESGPALLEPNCRHAVFLPGGSVIRVDLHTGASTSVDSLGEQLIGDAFNRVDMLQDGRAVGIAAGPLGIRVIDAVTGEIVATTGPGASFDVNAQVSDDARFIVSQSVLDQVEVFDAVADRVIHRWTAAGEVHLSPTGQQIAIVDSTGVAVHDQAGELLDRLELGSGDDTARFAMDGTMVICRSDGTYRWDLGSDLELVEQLDAAVPASGLKCRTATF